MITAAPGGVTEPEAPMDHHPTCLEHLEPAQETAERPRMCLLPGLTALAILAAIGLVSVLPAGALVFPGLGFAEVTGTVGAQADSRAQEPCPFAAALKLGLEPVCAMTLP